MIRLNGIIAWVNQNLVGVGTTVSALIVLSVRLYKFVKKIDLQFETIQENQKRLEDNITSDKEIEKLVRSHEKAIDEMQKRLDAGGENFKTLKQTLESMNDKLSAITSFLVNDPTSHEKINIIYETYKKNELEKFAK